MTEGTSKPKQRRGFAAMDKRRQREIAAMGGKAAHAQGTAHEWTTGEARSAGQKGGHLSRGGKGKMTEEDEVGASPAKR